jgi:DNA primase
MNQSEEIKAKLDIVDIIREYIQVKAVGANFQALCPFHNEKTPSFVISPEKQVWHCFGCGRGGDVFAFVMEKEGLNFIETLRLLAPKAGVVLRQEASGDYSKRNRLLDILELAAKYYSHILTLPAGAEFRAYLEKRGLKSETIQDWNLGVSQEAWTNLYDFLKQRPLQGRKFTDEEIFAAGLTIRKDNGRGYYDRFRGRLMFPIRDHNRNVIAFTARQNPNKEKIEKMGKYINSPQTAVYDKSRVLFGLDKAKQAIRDQDEVIIVEGQMDVISCHQADFKNVVASSGTALSAEQVTLIKRYTNNVSLLFDMDAAGQMAADRGIKEVLSQDLNLKIIVLPDGKDPDECIRHDKEAFRQAVASAKPMLDYYYSKVSSGLDLDNLDNKRLVRDKMFAMIALVNKKTEQGYWLKRLSEELGFFEPDTREEFLKQFAAGGVKDNNTNRLATEKIEESLPKESREQKLSELLLALLIRYPEHLIFCLDNLNPDYLTVREAAFYKELVIYYNKTGALEYESFKEYLQKSSQSAEVLDRYILLSEKEFYDKETGHAKEILINIIADLKNYSRQRLIGKIQKDLAIAEKAGNSEEISRLMAELKNITNF